MMVHARIGGRNWEWYDGKRIEKEPWFIAKYDDGFDNTYCDIYVRIPKCINQQKPEEDSIAYVEYISQDGTIHRS